MNKEEVLTHLFNAYHELDFAEQELDDVCLEPIVKRAKKSLYFCFNNNYNKYVN